MKLPCLPTQAHLELSSNSLYAALEQGPTHDVEFQVRFVLPPITSETVGIKLDSCVL